MKYLSENIISNKKVIIRCDLNVSIKDNIILDNTKIIKSLETIKLLLSNNNQVIILSHLGRVKTEEDKEKNSLYIVYEELLKFIDLDFIPNPFDLSVINHSNKKCFLVENTRYTDIPQKKESANDLELAKYWASFADVFVLDGFGSMHRAHSSTAGLGKYLPTYIGLLAEKEIKSLSYLKEPERPFLVIMGGAKVDDKILIINELIKRCDKLVLTGGILNSFLKVSNKNIGESLHSEDKDVLDSIINILNKYHHKIYFVNDFVIKRENVNIRTSIDGVKNNDVIFDNRCSINELVHEAKTIFLNGTCGKYEMSEYESGTRELLEMLANCNKNVFIGGGDTVTAVNKYNLQNKFYYVSTGGGATLEFIATHKLKALDWIIENSVDNQ